MRLAMRLVTGSAAAISALGLVGFVVWRAGIGASPEATHRLKALRSLQDPVPVEIALATLPLFRTSARPAVLRAETAASSETQTNHPVESSQSPGGGHQLGSWIMSLAADSSDAIWAATENDGVWKLPADAKTNGSAVAFFSAEGIDLRIYAIACDRLNRIWAGTLNQGVYIFNGVAWQHYDLLGERVYSIKVSPVDGSVWVTTNRGLNRWIPSTDEWQVFTQADGFAANEVQSMAFDKNGTIYAATQSHGLAVGTPQRSTLNVQDSTLNSTNGNDGSREDAKAQRTEEQPGLEYKKWRVVRGLRIPGESFQAIRK